MLTDTKLRNLKPRDKLYKVNDREGLYVGVASENGIYGHSRFCNTDFDDKLACLNLFSVLQVPQQAGGPLVSSISVFAKPDE